MVLVRFAQFIDYENRLTEISNSLMGLLAGSKLASHLLILNEGSTKLLPEVFPKVEHIQRFSLTSEKAREILEEAEVHLGTMGTPYILALHEDFMNVCINFFQQGLLGLTSTTSMKLSLQHKHFEKITGMTFSADSIGQLHVIRCMRNCVIHNGGKVNQALLSAISALTSSAVGDWSKLASEPFRFMKVGDPFHFGHSEMILTLAITKKLAKETNEILQKKILPIVWADLIVQEMLTVERHLLSRSDILRKVNGYARHNFNALSLSSEELEKAISRVKNKKGALPHELQP